MRDIFISYVHEDREIAEALGAKLEEAGYTTWHYTRDNPSGDYVKEITDAIGQCQAFALIISPDSVNNPTQVYPEIVQAHEGGKTLIPLRSNISHEDFKKLRPEWAFMLASRITIEVPPDGVGTIVPSIVRDLQREGKMPSPDATGPLRASASSAEALRSAPQREPKSVITKPAARLKSYIAAASAVLAIAAIIGYFISDREPPKPQWKLRETQFDDPFANVNYWKPKIDDWMAQQSALQLKNQRSLIYVNEEQLWVGDFTMKFHLKLLNDGGAAWALRVRDQNNYYLFYLAGPGGRKEAAGNFYTYIVRNGDEGKPIKTERAADLKLTPNGEYDIYIVVKGNVIAHQIQPKANPCELEHDDDRGCSLGVFTDKDRLFSEGSIGFRTVGAEEFAIGDLYVWPPSEKRPVKLPEFVVK